MEIFYNKTLEELHEGGYEPFHKPGLVSLEKDQIADLEKLTSLIPTLINVFCFDSDYEPRAWFSNPLEGFVLYTPGTKSRNPPELKDGGIPAIVLPLKKIKK